MLPNLTYHPDDIAGKYNPAVEEYYKEQITRFPKDPWTHWCLTQLYVTKGRNRDALKAYEKGCKALEPTRDNLKAYHWRVIYEFLERAQIDNSTTLFGPIPEQFHTDPIHKGLMRKFFMLHEADAERGVLPVDLLYDGWWNDGPFEVPKENLKVWIAIYVTHIDPADYDGKRIFCAQACWVDPTKPEKPEAGWLYPTVAEMTQLMPEEELMDNIQWFLEMGEYNDGKIILKARPRLPFNLREWEQSIGLAEVQSDLDDLRYLRNWGKDWDESAYGVKGGT